MRSSAFIPRAGLVITMALAAAACTEVTEPIDAVEVRVAHAIPGFGTQTVLLNGQPSASLAPGAHVFFAAPDVPTTYGFSEAGTLVERTVVYEENINAVVLMNAAAPAVHYFPLEREIGEVRLMVVNGDFSTDEPLTIRIHGGAVEFEEAMDPGAHLVIEPGEGAFDVWARPADADEFEALPSFGLIDGDHGFLIVVRDPDPAIGFDWMLF